MQGTSLDFKDVDILHWRVEYFLCVIGVFIGVIWVGFLGVCVEVLVGGKITPPCLKLVRIML